MGAGALAEADAARTGALDGGEAATEGVEAGAQSASDRLTLIKRNAVVACAVKRRARAKERATVRDMTAPSRAESAGFSLRAIVPADDVAVAEIIRAVMPEFGAVGAGFAIEDPEVDFMSRAYSTPRAAYFVIERDGRVLGGAGVGPLAGAPESVCELRKMYFLPEARGFGMGEVMLRKCIEASREFGYETMYLETLTGMDAAQRLYARLGFVRREHSLGATGHHGCNRYYTLAL